MFASPAPAAYAPPPPPVSPAPLPKAKGPNKAVLIAILGTLVFLAVVAVLIFAIKK